MSNQIPSHAVAIEQFRSAETGSAQTHMQTQAANPSDIEPAELRQLASYFARIDDPLARRALLDLVAAVAESAEILPDPPKRPARKRRDKFRRTRVERPHRTRTRKRRT